MDAFWDWILFVYNFNNYLIFHSEGDQEEFTRKKKETGAKNNGREVAFKPNSEWFIGKFWIPVKIDMLLMAGGGHEFSESF